MSLTKIGWYFLVTEWIYLSVILNLDDTNGQV